MKTSVIAIALVVVLALRQLREKNVKPIRLLISPFVVLVASLWFFADELLASSSNGLFLLGSAAVGIAIGVSRAKFTSLKMDAETEEVIVRTNQIGLFIWLGLLVGKRLIEEAVFDRFQLADYSLLIPALVWLWCGQFIARNLSLYWKYLQLNRDSRP